MTATRNIPGLDVALADWRRVPLDHREVVLDAIGEMIGHSPVIARKFFAAAELLRAAAEPEAKHPRSIGYKAEPEAKDEVCEHGQRARSCGWCYP
jgi:hypothetical protein